MVLVAVIFCLSVRHTDALQQNERTLCYFFHIAQKGNLASFLAPRGLESDVPFHLKFALKVDRVLSNEVHMTAYVTPKSSKRWFKNAILLFLLIKFSFSSIKICYTVSLGYNI